MQVARRKMTARHVIALLGRRDEPTDAVEEYCRNLGVGLAAHNFQLKISRVPWDQHGWSASLEALHLQAQAWRDTWVLLQYTALAWSARGFPRRFLQVMRVLRRAGARIAVVYHDAQPFSGTRLIDRLRREIQLRTMRSALAFADHSVFTVAPECIGWHAAGTGKSSFIPVGAGLTFPFAPQQHEEIHSPPTIAVYSITGGTPGERETRLIIGAVSRASQKVGALRLLVFGRHAEIRETTLREGLRSLPVTLDVCGVIDDQELLQRFVAADVLLFVRGTISSRRSSAIAGIACGLPVIAFQGKETAAPITEAGVILIAADQDESALQAQLGEAIVRVFSEKEFRLQLVRRSHAAQDQYFSVPSIADRYTEFLNPPR
jgi:glycosyltransferase involved in cell wall biosynthesis